MNKHNKLYYFICNRVDSDQHVNLAIVKMYPQVSLTPVLSSTFAHRSLKYANYDLYASPAYTVIILKTGTPIKITVIVLKKEQLDFTVQVMRSNDAYFICIV